jgi:hypothetical protein
MYTDFKMSLMMLSKFGRLRNKKLFNIFKVPSNVVKVLTFQLQQFSSFR